MRYLENLTNSFRGMRSIFVLLIAVLLSGCAGKDHDFEYDGAFDPIEPINSSIYTINRKLDYVTLRPIAFAYDALMPKPGKRVVSNVFGNLGEPRNFVNHILQNRGDEALRTSIRFIFNTIVGVGGMFDVADDFGFEESKNDFGITFRAYITNDGMYLMLPLLGPSSILDAPGRVADQFADPLTYVDADAVTYSTSGLKVLHKRAEFLKQEDLLETAIDEYAFVRDFYEEHRRQQVPPAAELWFHPSKLWQ